ncbi:MAG: cAMP-binding protein [Actinomycetia bacterium]|nr:cAMP-binding protein [Actinomycetes bacterium]
MAERRLHNIQSMAHYLEPSVQERLAATTARHRYSRNQTVFVEGDASESLYIVIEGRVAIATHSGDGRETVVAVLGPSGLFGDLGLFDGGRRAAEARALMDTLVVEVPYEPILAVMQENPSLLWNVIRMLAQRVRATDEALADTVFLDVPARTAKRLLELSDGADDFKLPITQEELAGMVGASRERVNKALALFVKLGWLKVSGRNRYRIIDRAAIAQRAVS